MIAHGGTATATRVLAVLTAMVLQACAGQAPATAESHTVGDRAAAEALNQLGAPYRYGGHAPTGFDCSGLVHYAYAVAGRSVPRTTGALWEHAEPVADRELQRGDLLFFRFDGKMSHVGIYVGNGRFVHAPSSGKMVSMAKLHSGAYRSAYVRAGRLR